MNTSTRKIVVIVVFLAGLALGYWLFGYSEPVQAESISPVLERLSTLEKSLTRIEDCTCQEPCTSVPQVVTQTVMVTVTERLTTTVVITQVVPVTSTIIQLVPITSTITVTPVPPEPTPTAEPSHCNQGVGNGSEGCSPGKSDNTVNPKHPHGPNDESPSNAPGNPGRKNEKVRRPKHVKMRGRSGK